MEKQFFSDGIGQITVIGGMVRLDFVTYSVTEKDAKGKMCRGHIKRWFVLSDEVRSKYGDKAEIYRCERCKTVYLPNPGELPRTQTLAW